jgi:hypothetical protein
MDEGLAGLAAGYGFSEATVALGRAVKGDEVNTGWHGGSGHLAHAVTWHGGSGSGPGSGY